jgi:hypothetical protein
MSENNDQVVTKSQFAAIAGVSRVRVSQYLAERKIGGDAIVGAGHRARIRVAVAMEQLRRNLDPVQALGANGRVSTDAGGVVRDTIETGIKVARLEQLALSNAKAVAEAAARSGRYMLVDDARQELGRSAARLLAVFESSLGEFAAAMMAEKPATQRDALRTLRTAWRTIRKRAAKATGTEAAALPPLLDDEVDNADRQPAPARA